MSVECLLEKRVGHISGHADMGISRQMGSLVTSPNALSCLDEDGSC